MRAVSSEPRASRPRPARGALALALFVALAAPAASAEQPAVALDALAPQAEVILRGTCTRATPRWDAASGLVVTDATIAVHEVVVGRAPTTVVLSEPGGILPDRNFGMLVPHAARFAPGEESVLLLGRDRAGRLRVVGGARGKWRVEHERANGAARVAGEDWSALRRRLAARGTRPAGAP